MNRVIVAAPNATGRMTAATPAPNTTVIVRSLDRRRKLVAK